MGNIQKPRAIVALFHGKNDILRELDEKIVIRLLAMNPQQIDFALRELVNTGAVNVDSLRYKLETIKTENDIQQLLLNLDPEEYLDIEQTSFLIPSEPIFGHRLRHIVNKIDVIESEVVENHEYEDISEYISSFRQFYPITDTCIERVYSLAIKAATELSQGNLDLKVGLIGGNRNIDGRLIPVGGEIVREFIRGLLNVGSFKASLEQLGITEHLWIEYVELINNAYTEPELLEQAGSGRVEWSATTASNMSSIGILTNTFDVSVISTPEHLPRIRASMELQGLDTSNTEFLPTAGISNFRLRNFGQLVRDYSLEIAAWPMNSELVRKTGVPQMLENYVKRKRAA